MAAKTFKMTSEGKAELEKELDYLKTEGRIDIAEMQVLRSFRLPTHSSCMIPTVSRLI